MTEILLDAQLTAGYPNKPVLRECALKIRAGEVFGLAGESGCGKSTLAMALLRLLPRDAGLAGRLVLAGADLLALSEREMRRWRGRRLALVPQSPLAALNPALRLESQLREAWQVHEEGDWRPAVAAALADTRLPSDPQFLARYPRQLSVGMAQRVLIAMAVLHRPQLLIADEATSALDLITQAEILRLFRQLNRAYAMSILYITHDLASAYAVCDRIGILYDGEVVEVAPPDQLFHHPCHPYTRRLVAALPTLPAAPPETSTVSRQPLPAWGGLQAALDFSTAGPR